MIQLIRNGATKLITKVTQRKSEIKNINHIIHLVITILFQLVTHVLVPNVINVGNGLVVEPQLN